MLRRFIKNNRGKMVICLIHFTSKIHGVKGIHFTSFVNR